MVGTKATLGVVMASASLRRPSSSAMLVATLTSTLR